MFLVFISLEEQNLFIFDALEGCLVAECCFINALPPHFSSRLPSLSSFLFLSSIPFLQRLLQKRSLSLSYPLLTVSQHSFCSANGKGEMGMWGKAAVGREARKGAHRSWGAAQRQRGVVGRAREKWLNSRWRQQKVEGGSSRILVKGLSSTLQNLSLKMHRCCCGWQLVQQGPFGKGKHPNSPKQNTPKAASCNSYLHYWAVALETSLFWPPASLVNHHLLALGHSAFLPFSPAIATDVWMFRWV